VSRCTLATVSNVGPKTKTIRLPLGLRWVCWTSKSDLSNTTKWDQKLYLWWLWIWSHLKAGAKCELLFNKLAFVKGGSVEQKLGLSCSFRCDRIYISYCYQSELTLLCCLSLTWMFNNQSLSWGGFVEHLSHTSAAQQSVTRLIALVVMNLVTSKSCR